MDRLLLVRHGGSTGNEDSSFYSYQDSALCLTTNGIRQALATAQVLGDLDQSWKKAGNFNLDIYTSEYTRARQTARICLDEMGLLDVSPKISPLLNERNYGTTYDPAMDSDPECTISGSESQAAARVRARKFIESVQPVLGRADVLCFSHFGTIRAFFCELLSLSNAEMMKRDVPNGEAHAFLRRLKDGQITWEKLDLPGHVIKKSASFIEQIPNLL